jgi:hypothetical protein
MTGREVGDVSKREAREKVSCRITKRHQGKEVAAISEVPRKERL